MANYFDQLDPRDAMELEQLSRVLFELREHRADILGAYGVADEIALLERLYAGTLPEHPGYEHYLSARILADTRDSVRALVEDCLREARSA